MGWTEFEATHFKRGAVDRKFEMDNTFSDGYKVLKSVMVGSTWYGAVQKMTRYKTDTEGNRIPTGRKDMWGYDEYEVEDIPEDEKVVFGCVCLTSVRKDGPYKWFGYKDMDETMGPYVYECPESILSLLTPTDNEIANKWREDCRWYTKRKKLFKTLKVGDKIKFKVGDTEKHLQLMSPYAQFRTNWWKDCDSYNSYFPKKYIPIMSFEIM